MNEVIKGFSKLSRKEKTRLVTEICCNDPQAAVRVLESYLHPDPEVQSLHEGFAENTLSNYYMPLGVAPNFLVNGQMFIVPMAIEESSVVAAMAKSAAFWAERGGFRAEVAAMIKKGQIHLLYTGGDAGAFSAFFEREKAELIASAGEITEKMTRRGGGILSLELLDKTDSMEGYYQIDLSADTRDSMGANFINSTLEAIAERLKGLFTEKGVPGHMEVVMSILSNYTPDCRVRAEVSAPVEAMATERFSGQEFCRRFTAAVDMAGLSVERAVTHNKGIMNGVDAVLIATGNDFRAVEACAHAYAARTGQYTSLSGASAQEGIFRFSLEMPMAVGTIGGLTRLHPLAEVAMDILGQPDAQTLMQVAACVGLSQNFSAVRALVTSGIQQGHMKMHLGNILRGLGANAQQTKEAYAYFANRTVSHREVEDFLVRNKR